MPWTYVPGSAASAGHLKEDWVVSARAQSRCFTAGEPLEPVPRDDGRECDIVGRVLEPKSNADDGVTATLSCADKRSRTQWVSRAS